MASTRRGPRRLTTGCCASPQITAGTNATPAVRTETPRRTPRLPEAIAERRLTRPAPFAAGRQSHRAAEDKPGRQSRRRSSAITEAMVTDSSQHTVEIVTSNTIPHATSTGSAHERRKSRQEAASSYRQRGEVEPEQTLRRRQSAFVKSGNRVGILNGKFPAEPGDFVQIGRPPVANLRRQPQVTRRVRNGRRRSPQRPAPGIRVNRHNGG
jgi:hypothetical protein